MEGMSTQETGHLDYQQIAAFKIWYGDGTVYSSNDGSWNKAPTDGVQVVMIYFQMKDALGRYTRLYSSGCDYYALDASTGRFTSHFDDITKVSGHVLYGKYMNWEKLIEMEKSAFDDYAPELIPKDLQDLVS